MKILVFGGGQWGVNYIRELGRHCVGVVDIDPYRLEKIQKEYGVPGYDFQSSWPKFDGAIISTPPDTHVEIALPLVEDKKLVLIEKPLSSSMAEGYKLHKYKDQIMSGLIYLYHPQVEFLRQKATQIPIHHIYSRRTNSGPVREWLNCAWDLAPHDISISNYIMQQEPPSVSSISDYHFAVIHLTYVACETIIYVSWLGAPKIRLVELVPVHEYGERIIFDDMKLTLEVSPLHHMLVDFLSGKWDQKVSYDKGMEVVKVLEQT